MNNRQKILVFIDWFYPAHKAGGPIRSVYNMIMALSGEMDFFVVTSAYDIGESVSLEGVALNKWIGRENYTIIYLENKRQTIKRYKEIFAETNANSLYLNSLFSIGFTLKPILANGNKLKIVLAPRGMLKHDALTVKPLKKSLFLLLMRSTGFMRFVIWHASSEIEAKEVLSHFGSSVEIIVAQNLAMIMLPRPARTILKKQGCLRLIFLSRISAIKNLDFLLKILNESNNSNIFLDIYGPLEDKEYWNSCLIFIDKTGLNVSYKGILEQVEKEKVLWLYDYLVLPTKGENYGHVIAESFTASVPVIISRNTPWRNLAENYAGFDLELEESKFISCLNKLVDQEISEYDKFSKGAYEFSKKFILNNNIIEDNKKLFLYD